MLVEPGMPLLLRLQQEFGDEVRFFFVVVLQYHHVSSTTAFQVQIILADTGGLNRKRLSEIVFADETKLKVLLT